MNIEKRDKMKKRFTTTLDEELLKKLKIIAVQEDKTISEIFEELIKEKINKREG